MESASVWGVELSSYALRAVQMQRTSSGKPRITAWDIVDFVEEVEDLTDLNRHHVMARALFHFKSRHKLDRSRVFISVRGETAFNRTVVIPPVSDSSLDKLLEYEAQQQIPFPLDDVYWDHRVLSIREDGEIHASLYAVRRILVEDRLRRLSSAKFPVDAVQLRPIALHNFCAAERHLEPGTIVIAVDHGVLQILIAHDDQSWFRCLPVGGVDFIARIREAFGADHRTAVRMASGEGIIGDRERFLEIREEAGLEVAKQAVQVIEYYLAARPDIRPQGVILLESHRCAPPLAKHLKKLLGQPVVKPKGFRQVEVDPEVVTAGIQEHFHSLTVAAGLALQGIGKAEIEVRLFPQGLQRQLHGGRMGFVAAAVLLFALLIWAGISRDAAATEFSETGALLRQEVMGTRTLESWRGKLSTKKAEGQLKGLADPGKNREGQLPLVEQLYNAIEDWDQSGPVPRLVSISFGDGSTAEKNEVRIILAADERKGGEVAMASMDHLVATLKTSGLIQDSRPGDTWVAGNSVAVAPLEPPKRPWRIRLVHKGYSLVLGERP